MTRELRSTDSAPSRPGWRERAASPGLFGFMLIVAGIIAYANSLAGPFVLDDTASIVENASIRSLFPLGPVLVPPADAGVGGRPLANLTLALNHTINGLDVRGYHVANLVIHLAVGLVVFGLTRRTLLAPALRDRFSPATAAPIAFGIALLWLLHPLQTEAVTYLSQRTESLMALFYLLSLYSFVRGIQDEQTGWFAIAIACCVLGMATKEVMVTAPVIIFLYDRAFIAGSFRHAWQRRYKLHLGFAATWLLLIFLLVDVHERGIGYTTVSGWQYAAMECRVILHYLRLAIWPSPLVFDYGNDVLNQAATWPQAATLSALVIAVAWAMGRAPMVGFLGAWVFIILAPTSSVVPVAGQPMAEHRMYLPLLAVMAAAVLTAHRWLERRTIIACLAIGAALGYATIDRNRDYQTAIGLWTDTVAKRPANARAHAALGAAYLEKGQLPPAITTLERAAQLDPGAAEVHNNLAAALLDVDRAEEALRHFAASLRLRPGVASTHYNFGNALLGLGRASEAIAQQEQALILRADFPEARCALADAFLAAGRLHEAITSYQEALQRRPDLVPAHYGLAKALTQTGRGAEAVAHYEATLRAVPSSVEARYNFGNVLFALKRYAEAAQQFSAVVNLQPNLAEAHHNLANAYASMGRNADAIAHYELALKMQPALDAARANLQALRNAAGLREK